MLMIFIWVPILTIFIFATDFTIRLIFAFFQMAKEEQKELERLKNLNPDSPEYLSRYMPKL